ncbi:hypothetical protein NOS3756_33850 [Nostoc sp. NIES-3756]|uniref:gasdermin n=1 Tax=Nostoc sp. NIES-3756 TaxID=1751286 RepID=UPI000722FDA5|nr:hypothetical protein [Nostoc sp. NIES-3756]BAT54416.1 hypothetical protein NOS3756_33850 [Nostoc sp. NIES-3756]
MATCKDQAIDHLNQLGYNAIKLPREGITPLTILSRDPKTSISSIYGNVTDIIADPVPTLPKVFENLQAGTISGIRTNKLELKFGISILNDLLSALGGKSAGIESVFGKASTIEFEYENVQYDTVMPASVTKFLRGANPSIEQDFIPQFNEQGEAYIIIDVLKSNSFGIRLYQDSERGIDINIDALKNVIGLSSKISVEKKVDTKISFNGSQALGFGFKACPIWVETVGGVSRFKLNPNTNQNVALRGPTESTAEPTLDDEYELTPVLIAPNQLIELA